MNELIFILGFILIASLIYAVVNMLSKIEKLEDLLEESEKSAERLSKYILKFSETLIDVRTRLKEIDSRELFVSDDEVGFVYKALEEEVKRLYEFANEEEKHGKEEKK